MKRIKLFIIAVISMSVMSSCLKSPDVTTQFYSNVMVVHASCDGPSVDVLTDNTLTASGLAYGTNTAYQKIGEGIHNYKLNVNGTSITAINTNPTLERNKNYSLYAINNSSNTTEGYMVDDIYTTPPAGKCNIRFIHLSGQAPKMDFGYNGGANLFTNVAFKDVTSFVTIDAFGPTLLSVKLAGTSNQVINMPTQYFESGHTYTVYISGYYQGFNKPVFKYTLVENK